MVAVVDIPSPCASRMTSSQGSVRVFRGATSFRTRSTSISAPPPGNESNPAACSRMRVSLTVSPLRRAVNDFGRRQGVYIYWILGLDGREEVFIVVNIQVRVEATLHQDPRPPKFQCLFYLGEYLLLPEEITVTRAGGTVEGAEVTLSQAAVRVVDVAVNNERNLLLRHRPPPLLHREGAKGKEIPAPKQCQGVLIT